MMMDKNLDHNRALHAYTCIEEIENCGKDDFEKKYHSVVRSCGILIQRSGLMQTLSFYLSKKDKKNNTVTPYEKLADHILQWIYRDGKINDRLQIYQNILNLEDEDILYKTQEAKSFVFWLKRYADTLLKGEDT